MVKKEDVDCEVDGEGEWETGRDGEKRGETEMSPPNFWKILARVFISSPRVRGN